MPNNSIKKASDLNGLFIYQDPKKGTIFYDILTRKGYVLTSSNVRKYILFSSSFSIALVIAILGYTLFQLKIVPTLIVFVLAYLLLEIFFRVTFIYKLPVADNFKTFKKDNIFMSLAKNYSATRLIILIVLLLVLTILMPLYAKIANLDQVSTIGSYIISILTFVFAIISIIGLITKKKNNL